MLEAFTQSSPTRAAMNQAYLSPRQASGRKTPSVHKGGSQVCQTKGSALFTGTGVSGAPSVAF